MRASMRQMPSHLRTRIAAGGMDYKGYNIAIHELGHNVEQTISQHFVDNRFINGIPNTAFTEALAFVFQKRDLRLLGIRRKDPLLEHLEVLDIFWNSGTTTTDDPVDPYRRLRISMDAEAVIDGSTSAAYPVES